jgi:hypothetical protein
MEKSLLVTSAMEEIGGDEHEHELVDCLLGSLLRFCVGIFWNSKKFV